MLQLHADFFVVGLALFVFPLAVASRFVHWTPDLWVRVRALAGDVLLCSWASRGTLAVHTSLHPSVRWVLVNLMLVVILRRTSIPSREVGGGGGRNTSRCPTHAAECGDKNRPDGPLCSCLNFTFTYLCL